MKTLDEVIRAIEECRDSYVAEKIIKSDALHYLKEYRSEKAMWKSDRKGYLDWIEQYKESREKHQQAVIELKKNPPLTWDELKTMQGKPVWVEEENLPSQWYLIDEVETDEDDDPEFVSMNVYDCQGDYLFYKNNIGTKWQAYRKERW